MASIVSVIKKVLDTVRAYRGAPIYAVKGDYNSRFINAVICTDGDPHKIEAGASVTVTFEKEDKTAKTFDGGQVNSDGSVTVPVTSWALQEEGDVWCNISVSTADSNLTTTKLMIIVQDRGNVGGAITEDDPEYDDILSILARLSDHDVRIEQNTKNAQSALEYTSRNSKRITNLEQRLDASLFVRDDSVSYAKPVPEGALPYAEITKIGGMTYRDEATNTLKNAGVTKIKSTGKNLLPFPYYKSNQTMSGVTFVANNDGGIAVSGTPTDNAYMYLSNRLVISGCDYICVSLQGEFSNVTLEINFFDKDGKMSYQRIEFTTQKKMNLSSDYPNAHSMSLVIKRISDNVECSGTAYPMINIGSDYLPHELYKESVLEIPAAAQALDGYRNGLNRTYYNYIDWRTCDYVKTYNKLVNKKVFNGNENWTLDGSTGRFETSIVGAIEAWSDITRVLSNHYKSGRAGYPDTDCISIDGNNRIYVHDSNFTTVNAWKAHLAELYANGNPLVAYYALATPIVTDISDLLPDDNFIEVHEGGVVIAENENGLGVPTTITYQLKEAM